MTVIFGYVILVQKMLSNSAKNDLNTSISSENIQFLYTKFLFFFSSAFAKTMKVSRDDRDFLDMLFQSVLYIIYKNSLLYFYYFWRYEIFPVQLFQFYLKTFLKPIFDIFLHLLEPTWFNTKKTKKTTNFFWYAKPTIVLGNANVKFHIKW